MKINDRDVTLTSEELDLLKMLKAIDVMSITKSDEDVLMWHDRDFLTQGSMINVRWFKGFDWMQKGEMLVVGKLIDESEKPATVWDLKVGDAYWWVSTLGEICKDVWNGACFNIECRSQGNAFLTEKEAEFEAKRREVVAKVRKYARPYIPNKDNYFPYYDGNYKCIQISCTCDCYYDMLSFNSYGDIHKAIDEVGEDDFKKYYLGVTE